MPHGGGIADRDHEQRQFREGWLVLQANHPTWGKAYCLNEWAVHEDVGPFQAPEQALKYLSGICPERGRGGDGSITTSHVSEVDGRFVKTRGGSLYYLGKPKAEYLAFLKSKGIPFDITKPFTMKAGPIHPLLGAHMPAQFILEEWAVHDGPQGKYLSGIIPDSHRMGRRETTPIVSSHGREVTTIGGTIYFLGEVLPEYRAFLQQEGMPFDPENPISVAEAEA